MKRGRKLTAAERTYLESTKLNSRNWMIAKKESHVWTLVHRYVKQTKQVLAPK